MFARFGKIAALLGASVSLAATSCTVHKEISSAGQPAMGLEAVCSPDAMQHVVSTITSTKVSVKELAGGPKLPGGTRFNPATNTWPAFCQVTGSFVTNPATGKTANFLATLPANWNGKFLQLGCGGHCGSGFIVNNPAQPTITATYPGAPTDIIARGYASIGTDQGHDGRTGGLWAIQGPGKVDQEAIDDFFYRADKVLAPMGKELTRAFYARLRQGPQKISRSYFTGCSGGGRDALVAASYFPEEFDGIIAGSAYNGAGTNFQFAGVTLASIRSEAAYVPPELIRLIDPIVKAQCDKLDGVEDGLIQNPMACNFRPERDLPKCDGTRPAGQCFTPTQIETISAAFTAVTDEKGNVVQPGFAISDVQPATFTTPKRPADLAALDPFPNADNGDVVSGGYWALADAFLKVFVHKNDPNFYTRSLFTFRSGGAGKITDFRVVVPQGEAVRVLREARMGIGHFPENVSPFIRQNRKLLIWHNFSDQTLTPYMSVNYYKQLAARFGGYAPLQRNVRLFALPGTPHCNAGGVGPNTFDALTAMETWVEKGVGPDAIPGSLQPSGGPYGMREFNKAPLRTMPLCKFPEMARYKGTGDVKDGANWFCPAGDTSMLKIGESGRRAGVIE